MLSYDPAKAPGAPINGAPGARGTPCLLRPQTHPWGVDAALITANRCPLSLLADHGLLVTRAGTVRPRPGVCHSTAAARSRTTRRRWRFTISSVTGTLTRSDQCVYNAGWRFSESVELPVHRGVCTGNSTGGGSVAESLLPLPRLPGGKARQRQRSTTTSFLRIDDIPLVAGRVGVGRPPLGDHLLFVTRLTIRP